MSQSREDIKRWTTRSKETAVMDVIKGKTTAAELARSQELTVAEVEKWMDDFVSLGSEALLSHPRDAEARHHAEKKELLAKIGELTMEKEVWKVARDILGKPLPDPQGEGSRKHILFLNSTASPEITCGDGVRRKCMKW